MDLQVVLIVILSLLTVNLIVVGIYVVMILKEFRETMKKFNKVLDTFENVTESVAAPIITLSNIAAGITSTLKVLDVFKSFKKKRSDEEEE